MASGRLAVSNPAANTSTLVYTVPAGKISSFNISAVNMSTADLGLTIYISDNSTTDPARLIENNITLVKNGGVLERGGILANSGERVYVLSTSNAASIRLYGFED